jgi:20S proteasome alpha/beta subunit
VVVALACYCSKLSPRGAALLLFVLAQLAKALRKSPFNVNLLLAGVDMPVTAEGEDEAAGAAATAKASATPSLYWIDYMGTMAKVNYGCHGYAAYFTGGLLDKDWREGMTEAEALGLLGKCIAETRMRFMLNQPAYSCYKIDSHGVTAVDIASHIPIVPNVADVPVVRAAGVGTMAPADTAASGSASSSASAAD